MKWDQGKLIKRAVIVLSGSIGGIIGSYQGGWIDTIAYATVWIFVAWSSLRQPAVLLMATPAFIIFGILDRSLGAATNGAFFGILTYWAVAAPDNSLRRRFSLKFFEELFNDELSKPILIFLLAFPFHAHRYIHPCWCRLSNCRRCWGWNRGEFRHTTRSCLRHTLL
jgi:hypothetical protein